MEREPSQSFIATILGAPESPQPTEFTDVGPHRARHSSLAALDDAAANQASQPEAHPVSRGDRSGEITLPEGTVADLENDFFYVMIVGAKGAGKTTFAKCLAGKPPRALPEEPTVGMTHETIACHSDEASIKFRTWDTSGEKRTQSDPAFIQYVKKSPIVFLVAAIDNGDMEEDTLEWYKKVLEHNPTARVYLIINKIDYWDIYGDSKSRHAVKSRQEVEALIRQFQAVPEGAHNVDARHWYVSARNNLVLDKADRDIIPVDLDTGSDRNLHFKHQILSQPIAELKLSREASRQAEAVRQASELEPTYQNLNNKYKPKFASARVWTKPQKLTDTNLTNVINMVKEIMLLKPRDYNPPQAFFEDIDNRVNAVFMQLAEHERGAAAWKQALRDVRNGALDTVRKHMSTKPQNAEQFISEIKSLKLFSMNVNQKRKVHKTQAVRALETWDSELKKMAQGQKKHFELSEREKIHPSKSYSLT